MDKHTALNAVRIAAANAAEARGQRVTTKEDHIRKTRALAEAETAALLAGASAQEVMEAAQ